MFKKLFNFFKNLFPRKQEMRPVDAQGLLLNRKQRRHLQFRVSGIKNNRKQTKGRKTLRKLFNSTVQHIKLKNEQGEFTGEIKTIIHQPKQSFYSAF